MKFFIFVFFIFVFLTFNSCTKYDEGPSFSLLSSKLRITGNWQYEKMIVASIELDLEHRKDIIYEFKRNGTGYQKTIIFDFLKNTEIGIRNKLEWKFENNNGNLIMRVELSNGTWGEWRNQEIIRLTNNEYWCIEKDFNNNEIQYRFSKI